MHTEAFSHTGRFLIGLVTLALVASPVAAEAVGRRNDGRRANRPAPQSRVSKQAPSERAKTNAQPLTSGSLGLPAAQQPRNPRVLFITAKNSERAARELARLEQKGGEFAKMRARGWTIGSSPENNVQILDREAIPDIVEKLGVRDFPTVACIDNGEIVRSFRSGCTTPLDRWTIGFLATGVDERPAGPSLEHARVDTTGQYPLRGNHWSVDGDWNPSRDKVITHLRSPNHANQLLASWKIEEWSYEELRSVHDDLHEKYDTGSHSPSRKKHVENYLSGGKNKF